MCRNINKISLLNLVLFPRSVWVKVAGMMQYIIQYINIELEATLGKWEVKCESKKVDNENVRYVTHGWCEDWFRLELESFKF